MADLPEQAFQVDKLLDELTTAFTKAATSLRHDFEEGDYKDAPFIYTMPRMSLEIKLTFSFTKEGVKGVFSKTRSKDEQELVSTMALDVVAAPRTTPPKP